MTFAIIVQCVNFPIGLRHSTKTVAPSILSVGILIEIVPKMKDVIHRIFPYRIPIRVKEPERVIAARVHRKTDLRNQIMSLGCRFRTPYRALEVRVADAELIVILSVRPQFLRLNLSPTVVRAPRQHIHIPYSGSPARYLQRVVYIRARVCHTRVHHIFQSLVRGHFEPDTDGCLRRRRRFVVPIMDRNRVEQGDQPGDCRVVIDVVVHWCASCP